MDEGFRADDGRAGATVVKRSVRYERPSRFFPVRFALRTCVVLNLKEDGTADGEWQTDIGTGGVFRIFRANLYAGKERQNGRVVRVFVSLPVQCCAMTCRRMTILLTLPEIDFKRQIHVDDAHERGRLCPPQQKRDDHRLV